MTGITDGTNADTGVVIEWAPFIVKQGVSEASLLSASSAVQMQFLEKQKGFIKRELFKGEGKRWVDLVYWESDQDARRAVVDAAHSSTCLAYFAMMESIDQDDLGKGVSHYKQMLSWN